MPGVHHVGIVLNIAPYLSFPLLLSRPLFGLGRQLLSRCCCTTTCRCPCICCNGACAFTFGADNGVMGLSCYDPRIGQNACRELIAPVVCSCMIQDILASFVFDCRFSPRLTWVSRFSRNWLILCREVSLLVLLWHCWWSSVRLGGRCCLVAKT